MKPTLHSFKQFITLHRATAATIVALLVVVLGYTSFRFPPVYVIGGVVALGVFFLVLRKPWYGVLLMAFFLPFERIGSIDISGVTVRPSQVTALLTLFAVMLTLLAERKRSHHSNPFVWPLAIFMVISLFGLLNAPQLERSVMVLFFILFTTSIALLLPVLVKQKANVQQLLIFLYAGFLFVTLFGLFQFVGDLAGLPPSVTGLRDLYTKEILGFPRVQSTALEPLYFANYLLVPLSILLSLFLARVHKTPGIHSRLLKPSSLFLLFGLGAVNLVLTVARGGYIAFTLSALLILGVYFVNRSLLTGRNLAIAGVSMLFGFVVLSKIIGLEAVADNFLGHVSNLFGGASYNERVEMYEIAHRAWLEHPLVGIGPGSFGPYASWNPNVVPAHGWNIVNNEYLELLAEHGVLGFITMLVIFLMVIIRSLKAFVHARDPFLRAVLVGTLAGFLGILLQYNTFSVLYIVHIWFVIGLLIALQEIILYPNRRV